MDKLLIAAHEVANNFLGIHWPGGDSRLKDLDYYTAYPGYDLERIDLHEHYSGHNVQRMYSVVSYTLPELYNVEGDLTVIPPDLAGLANWYHYDYEEELRGFYSKPIGAINDGEENEGFALKGKKFTADDLPPPYLLPAVPLWIDKASGRINKIGPYGSVFFLFQAEKRVILEIDVSIDLDSAFVCDSEEAEFAFSIVRTLAHVLVGTGDAKKQMEGFVNERSKELLAQVMDSRESLHNAIVKAKEKAIFDAENLAIVD